MSDQVVRRNATDPRYCCPICLELLKIPVQTICGHRFCKDCISPWVRDETCCPSCRTALTASDVYPDKATQREIRNLQVPCIRPEAHAEQCDSTSVACPLSCGQYVCQSQLDEHRRRDCPERPITCTSCQLNVKLSYFKTHASECPFRKVMCEYCSSYIIKNQLALHQERDCEGIPVGCQFAAIGCPFVGTRDEVEAHQSASVPSHLSLLLQSHLSLLPPEKKQPMVPLTLLSPVSNVNSLSGLDARDVGALSAPACLNQPRLNQANAIPVISKKQRTTHPNVMEPSGMMQPSRPQEALPQTYGDGLISRTSPNHRSECQSNTETPRCGTFETRSLPSPLQHELKAMEERTKALELVKVMEEKTKALELEKEQLKQQVSELEAKLSVGRFLKRQSSVRAFTLRSLRHKKPVDAPPETFCCGTNGYKMSLRVKFHSLQPPPDPLGGLCRGHLSLSIHLHGESNNFLSWPISTDLTLTMIQQLHEGDVPQNLTRSITIDKSSLNFQRLSDDESIELVSFEKFHEIEKLEDDGFYKDDSLLFEVKIDV